jgi:hypothetical protein
MPTHVDEFLDREDGDPVAREYLSHARRPAILADRVWLHANAPFVTWRDKEYRCVGASTLGDVWLKDCEAFGGGGSFYDHRVSIDELSGWRAPPHPMPASIDRIMENMPQAWRKRWCTTELCACLGCANGAGGLPSIGITREQWEEWRQRTQA